MEVAPTIIGEKLKDIGDRGSDIYCWFYLSKSCGGNPGGI